MAQKIKMIDNILSQKIKDQNTKTEPESKHNLSAKLLEEKETFSFSNRIGKGADWSQPYTQQRSTNIGFWSK